MMMEAMKFGYEKHNADVTSAMDKKRICGYFVVSDLHKVTDVDIRFRTQELLEEVAKHEDWILESIIWDANHKVDINREGLNTILEKAKNDEFDILLLHHVTIISRQGGKTFDYVLQLHRLDKSVYGIIDNIHSLDELVKSLHLSIPRQKQYEELKRLNG